MDLSRHISGRNFKGNVFSRHDFIFRKHADSRLMSQHRKVVLAAQMSQDKLVSPVPDQFSRERCGIVVRQMPPRPFNPLFQIKRIGARFKHTDIMVRFEVDQIASRKILPEIVRYAARIRRDADPAASVCQPEADGICRVMRSLEGQALHLAQGERNTVFEDDPVLRRDLSDPVSDLFPCIEIRINRYVIAARKYTGSGNMIAVFMSDQNPVQVMRIFADFEKLLFNLLSVFPGIDKQTRSEAADK